MRRIWTATAIAASLMASAAPAHEAPEGGDTVLVGPTTLTEGRTVVPVRLGHGPGASAGRPELVIDGLAFDTAPGVLYQVLLQGPGGRLAPLGMLNFYNLTAPTRGAPSPALRSARFDATEALRRLGGQATALVFEPSAGVSGVRARVDPGARVRFVSASIRWH